MGELKDKAKGVGNQIAGSVKQAAGDATDDHSLEAEGKAQGTKGKVQKAVGSVKGALGNDV
ncbi:MAG: CsbD family protein [Novosphingobium sp.]